MQTGNFKLHVFFLALLQFVWVRLAAESLLDPPPARGEGLIGEGILVLFPVRRCVGCV